MIHHIQSPLRDIQLDQPLALCHRCQAERYSGMKLYRIDGEALCPECFEDWVKDLLYTSPDIVADRLGAVVEILDPYEN